MIQQSTNLEVRSLSMVKMGMWAALALFVLCLAYFIMIMAVLAEHKTRSLMALGWILLLAGITCTLHFTTLTALRELRQNNPAEVNWPSPWLAADCLVWDLFLSLSMLFAAPVFSGPGLPRVTRILLRVVAVMCLLGMLGPLTGRMGLHALAGAGYGLVFPVACLLITLVLRRRLQERTDLIVSA